MYTTIIIIIIIIKILRFISPNKYSFNFKKKENRSKFLSSSETSAITTFLTQYFSLALALHNLLLSSVSHYLLKFFGKCKI